MENEIKSALAVREKSAARQFNAPYSFEPPGASEYRAIVLDKDGIVIGSARQFAPDEEIAIARLWAASPDLLAACEQVLRAVAWRSTADRLTGDDIANVLRPAIAKAKGETP